MTVQPVPERLTLRPPDVVMRLARMGAAFPTRLSFTRSLVRRMGRERWSMSRPIWAIDADGVGRAAYRVATPHGIFGLAAFSQNLTPTARTDRVIAEAWDASFALTVGEATPDVLDRLAAQVPLQEAGRFSADELVLSRANRSVRLFEHVVERLAAGRQPDAWRLAEVGYLMRTTAVYGNGKFGIADRPRLHDGPVLEHPFQAEMLTVYLIRHFTLDLADHMAARRSGGRAVPLDRALRRGLGIGNATGLGMAPFLVGHPQLVHRWFLARETAIARVRALPTATPATRARFAAVLARAHAHVARWRTDNPGLRGRLDGLGRELASVALPDGERPWHRLMATVEATGSLDLQELVASLILEPHGDGVDDLEGTMASPEAVVTDPTMPIGRLRALIDQAYGWALGYDFARPDAQHLFWYASEEKLEPRLGERWTEPGAKLETRIGVAREVQALRRALEGQPDASVAAFLLAHPEHRHWVARVQSLASLDYAEIRDNLLDRSCLPIDILRCKLAFFGAARFDPKSDRWVRVTLFQGAPLADEFGHADADDWAFAATPA